MATEKKPSHPFGGGGHIPAKSKPPITGGNTNGNPGGSYAKGVTPPPKGGSGKSANKKSTP